MQEKLENVNSPRCNVNILQLFLTRTRLYNTTNLAAHLTTRSQLYFMALHTRSLLLSRYLISILIPLKKCACWKICWKWSNNGEDEIWSISFPTKVRLFKAMYISKRQHSAINRWFWFGNWSWHTIIGNSSNLLNFYHQRLAFT